METLLLNREKTPIFWRHNDGGKKYELLRVIFEGKLCSKIWRQFLVEGFAT